MQLARSWNLSQRLMMGFQGANYFKLGKDTCDLKITCQSCDCYHSVPEGELRNFYKDKKHKPYEQWAKMMHFW